MLSNKYNEYILTIIIGMVLTIFSSMCLSMTYHDINNVERTYGVELEKPEQLEKKITMEVITYYNPRLTQLQKRMIAEVIFKEARLTNLDPFFITSVIAAESSFRPNAVSPCAARGLMQITGAVSDMMHVTNPFNIEQNIFAGTRYLKMLHKQFKKDELVLAAYNAGPSRVARLQRIPNIRETVNYIKKVADFKKGLKVKFISNINRLMKDSMFKIICSSNALGNKVLNRQNQMMRTLSSTQNNIDLCEGRRKLFVIEA